MTDTVYDFDTDTSQCAHCFSQAPCGYDHADEADGTDLEGWVPDHVKPNEILNVLEAAEYPLTAMAIAMETGHLVETIEAELDRLAAKGLARMSDTRRWVDLLRSIPSA
jgi:hypothetical protein